MGITSPREIKRIEKREERVAKLRAESPRLKNAPDSIVEKLVDVLGIQPLALHLASAYLEERALFSPYPYITALEKTAQQLPIALESWVETEGLEDGRQLAATFLVSYRQLDNSRKEGRLAARLLRSAGYCSTASPIPAALLEAVAQPASERELAGALDRAIRLGLLLPENGEVAILPEIAQLARQMEDAQNPLLPELLDALVKLTREVDNPQRVQALLPLLPHFESAASYGQQAGLANAGRVWNNLGQLHLASQQFHLAQQCFARSLEAYEQARAADNKSVNIVSIVETYRSMGAVTQELGTLERAMEYYIRGLALQEMLARDHPRVATLCACIGRVHQLMGDFPTARDYFERSRSIHVKTYSYGPKHPETARDLYALGQIHFEMGDLDAARASFEEALAIDEWVYGPKHSAVTDDLYQLYRVFQAQGAHDAVRQVFERLMILESKVSGRDGQPNPQALNQLGQILQAMGRLTEAGTCFGIALAFDKETEGEYSAAVARDLNHIGNVLRELGDGPAARDRFQQALEIASRQSPPNPLEISLYADNLGRVLYHLNNIPGARLCFERVLEISIRMYGPHSLPVARHRSNLGSVLLEMGECEQARDNYQQALEIFTQHMPADHPSLRSIRQTLDKIQGR